MPSTNQNITPIERWLIIITLMSATLMQALDTTIVNVVLPHMQGALSASPDQISWTLTSYIVAAAIFMPLSGYFSDILGTKKYLLLCIGGFTFSSALCGAAHSLTEMVIFRMLQGAFGAGLVPLSQAILADVHAPKDLGKAMAIWGVGIMIGPILGPTLGGYLTDIANWRWTFYVNLPVGIMAFLLALQTIPDSLKKTRRMDWLEFIYLALTIGSLQFFLDRGNQNDWFNSASIKIALVLAITGLLCFLIRNLLGKTDHAVFNLRIFKDRNFTISSLLMLILGAVLYGSLVIQPLLLEELLNYPVLTTGIIMAPRGISSMISMALSGKLINRVDPRLMIIFGIVLSAIGMSAGTYYSSDIDWWWLVWPLALQGFGMGIIFVPLSVVAFSTLPEKARIEAAGLFSLIRTIGYSIGIAITLTLFTRYNQIEWNRLGAFLQPYNLAVIKYLQPLHLQPGDHLAAKVLASELVRQAQMVSFVKIFAFIMWCFLAMLPLIFLLRHKKKF